LGANLNPTRDVLERGDPMEGRHRMHGKKIKGCPREKGGQRWGSKYTNTLCGGRMEIGKITGSRW